MKGDSDDVMKDSDEGKVGWKMNNKSIVRFLTLSIVRHLVEHFFGVLESKNRWRDTFLLIICCRFAWLQIEGTRSFICICLCTGFASTGSL